MTNFWSVIYQENGRWQWRVRPIGSTNPELRGGGDAATAEEASHEAEKCMSDLEAMKTLAEL